MWKFIRKRKYVSIVFTLLLSLIMVNSTLSVMNERGLAQAQINLTETHAGVYNGIGADDACATALYSLIEWMGSTVIWVDESSINNGTLNTLDLLAFPGGSPNTYMSTIGPIGVELIRQFIANGGSYIGICGGGMFATQFLGFCQGEWIPDIPNAPISAQCIEMTVNQESTGPDLSDEPASYQVLFWGSYYFEPAIPMNIIPIMFYQQNDETAMFVTRFGAGTVFASGPHPEFEEGSDRDGTATWDHLNDPDSEWNLLQKVTQWLIDESSDVPPFSPLTGIIIIVSAVAIIRVVGIVLIRKRRGG